MRKNKKGSQLYSEKNQLACSSSYFLSENLKNCSRLEAALDELHEADAQFSVNLSQPMASEDLPDFERLRRARAKCHEAAQTVLRSQPQTCAEKISMLDLITIYITIADLDQLELYNLRNSNLISKRTNSPPRTCVSVACLHTLTVEPGVKRNSTDTVK